MLRGAGSLTLGFGGARQAGRGDAISQPEQEAGPNLGYRLPAQDRRPGRSCGQLVYLLRPGSRSRAALEMIERFHATLPLGLILLTLSGRCIGKRKRKREERVKFGGAL